MNGMEYVWLAEKSGGSTGSEVYGIFSNPAKAKKPCQDAANEYFGAGMTPPLKWLGDAGHSTASYYQPGAGINFMFQVTRFIVDRECDFR